VVATRGAEELDAQANGGEEASSGFALGEGGGLFAKEEEDFSETDESFRGSGAGFGGQKYFAGLVGAAGFEEGLAEVAEDGGVIGCGPVSLAEELDRLRPPPLGADDYGQIVFFIGRAYGIDCGPTQELFSLVELAGLD